MITRSAALFLPWLLLGCDKEPDPADSSLCVPDTDGPYPAALYNHGGLGDEVGGDLVGTCHALADAGYLAYSMQRRLTTSLDGHLDDVAAGVAVLEEHADWNGENMAILGFSRGGLLTFQTAKDRSGLFDAIVLMAPADAKGRMMDELEDVGPIGAPVLLLVSENDLEQDDHVGIANAIKDALEEGDKEVEFILYPPYGSDGHALFFEVRDDYWPDVTDFLASTR